MHDATIMSKAVKFGTQLNCIRFVSFMSTLCVPRAYSLVQHFVVIYLQGPMFDYSSKYLAVHALLDIFEVNTIVLIVLIALFGTMLMLLSK